MFEQDFKNIDADLRNEAGCTTEFDYIEQTSWLLFLKRLDELEQGMAMAAELEGRPDGKPYSIILDEAYPRQFLKDQNLTKGTYNQIARYVVAESKINIAIGTKPPASYFKELAEQCNGGAKKYDGITDNAD